MIKIIVQSEQGEVSFQLEHGIADAWMGKTLDGHYLAVQGRIENGPLDDVLNLAQTDRWGLTL